MLLLLSMVRWLGVLPAEMLVDYREGLDPSYPERLARRELGLQSQAAHADDQQAIAADADAEEIDLALQV